MEKISFCEDRLDEVVDRYKELVYRVAFARTRDKDNADDVFQEVFLRYVRKRPDFKNEEHEKAWFIRVTINCCKTLWEKLKRFSFEEVDEEIPIIDEEPEEILEELLDELSPDYRVIIHLFYYEDMSTADISRILERKESTVRMQLTRARRMIKELIQEGGKVNV